ATVLGVSVLDPSSKAKFAKKYGLNFPLLADEDHAVAEKYGAWQEKSMYGRKYMGVARITYLIDGEGRGSRRWDKGGVGSPAVGVLHVAASDRRQLRHRPDSEASAARGARRGRGRAVAGPAGQPRAGPRSDRRRPSGAPADRRSPRGIDAARARGLHAAPSG